MRQSVQCGKTAIIKLPHMNVKDTSLHVQACFTHLLQSCESAAPWGCPCKCRNRCRSGTVLQGPYLIVECTELQQMCGPFASCHATALEQWHPPLWQSAALVLLAEEGQIHRQRRR